MGHDYRNFYQTIFPFWEHLDEADRELLCRSTSSLTYKKGELLHGGGGECTGAIVVRSGGLRAYLLSDEGREVTLYWLDPGEICVLSASCVLKSITFDVFVDAQRESEVLLINGKIFSEITDRNLYAQNFALSLAVERFSEVMWTMQQILFMSFDRRLARFLIEESEKTGSLSIRLTQEQIASYTGSAREVVSRMLKYFSSEGLVSHGRGGLEILDPEGLRRLAL